MIYIYDILLNLKKYEDSCEFYEWCESDEVEHIKKIPLFKVSKTMIEDLFTNKIQVDTSFLLKIKNKALCYFNGEVKEIPYATLLSDGRKCFALEFDSKGNSNYKSTLIIDEEEEVIEMTEELVETVINYKKEKLNRKELYLTRKEQQNRIFLLKELGRIKDKEEEISYLYEEYFEDELTNIKDKFTVLKESIYKGDSTYINNLKKFFSIMSKKNV